MITRTICFATLIAFSLAETSPCFAQETVSTRDGRLVVLNTDGTWHYATDAPSAGTGSALETLRAYLSAPSWRDRTSLVLNPERVIPLMESRYAGKKWDAPDFHLLEQGEPTPSPAGWVKVKADINGTTITYYLKATNDGFRIDWETSVGFNSMSPEEFRAKRPTTAVRFRVLAKLSDYYNYEFSGEHDNYYSIEISDGGREIGHGYAKKNDKTGQSLFEKLKDGREHPIVIDIQLPANAEKGRVYLISKVINLDDWWFEHPAQK